MICPKCSSCLLQPHPEQPQFHAWLKCNLCGYSIDVDEIKKQHGELSRAEILERQRTKVRP